MAAAPRLVLLLVVDGLRPDAITPEDTPALWRLRGEGVVFADSHAVFPTVTRVNAATLVTGAQPATHGIVGNEMYVPAVDPVRAFSTQDHRSLARLDEVSGGRLLRVPALAERLHAHGLRLAAVSSGSTGSGWLLGHRAAAGVGALVNGYLEPGRTVAQPAELNATVLAKFGPAPAKAAGGESYAAAVGWTLRVLREHVLPDLRPTVAIAWLTEPDHSQHLRGVGTPPARMAIRSSDREIGLLLDALATLGLAGATDILVASDHGFTTNTAGVDVAGELVAAGLKAGRDSDDVVLASSGQAVGLHVRDKDHVARVVRFLLTRDWGGVLFTAGRAPHDVHGVAPGTFSLALIHAADVERGPDVLLTFPWASAASAHGVRGTDLANVGAGGAPYASDHGSMSPWNVRNTLLAWGPDFKAATTIPAPAGNVDVTPTILALLGLPAREGLDGRVLAEALRDGPDVEQVSVERRVHTTATDGYRAAIQVSLVDGRRYVDKSWRMG
jgi:arylsulfatase A-like enzyme